MAQDPPANRPWEHYSLPKVLSDTDFASQQKLDAAVRGLLALVLIFNVYMLYQQHLLRKLRNDLAKQMEVATEERVRAETFYELAILDPLTGLYNRRFGEERLGTEIARADRYANSLHLNRRPHLNLPIIFSLGRACHLPINGVVLGSERTFYFKRSDGELIAYLAKRVPPEEHMLWT